MLEKKIDRDRYNVNGAERNIGKHYNLIGVDLRCCCAVGYKEELLTC